MNEVICSDLVIIKDFDEKKVDLDIERVNLLCKKDNKFEVYIILFVLLILVLVIDTNPVENYLCTYNSC